MLRLLKKAIIPVAVIALAIGASACSSSGSTGSDSKGPLTVWVMGDSGAHFSTLVKSYEKSSGTTVNVVAIPWDSVNQKLTTAVASGSGPDVVQVGLSSLRTFADAGALMDLDGKLGDYPNLAADKFADGVAGKATAIKGKIVSVPWISDTRVLFYRTDILKAAGIDSPPATWSELRADAKTLAGRGDGKYGYYIPQWDDALPVELTWGQGGDVIDKKGNVDLDTSAFKKAVDLYTGLYADKSVPTNADFDQTQGFVSGVAPMLVSGPYLAAAIKSAAPDLDGKWNITTLPSDNPSLFAGSNMAVWHNTKHQAAALSLLNYLSKPSTQLNWYKIDGSLPTVKAALSDSSFTSDPLVKVYSKQLKNAKLLPLLPNYDGGLGADILKALNSIALTGADKSSTLTTLYATTKGMSLK